MTNTDTVQEEPERFVRWSRPLSYLENAFRPPRFAVEGRSHVLADHGDTDWNSPTPEGFWDQPGAYLKWNLGGRLLTLWSFDNSHNGDVYIYPMKRKGFEEDRLLEIVHSSMRALSYVLAAASLSQLTTLALQRGSRGFSDTSPSSTPG